MKRVAVTSAGSSTAYSFVKFLSTQEEVEVVTMDINPKSLVFASSLSKIHIVTPLATDVAYEQFILNSMEEHQIDFIVPIHNAEIDKLSLLNDSRILTCVLDGSVINNKLLCYTECISKEIPVPKTWSKEEAIQLLGQEYLFAKKIKGVGSIGARKIPHGEVKELSGEFLFQELCTSPEVTVDCIAYREDEEIKVLSICRERLEVKAGVCTKAKVYQSDAINEIATSVARGFEVIGGFCFQVMKNQSGDFVVTDFNPRLGGGTALSQSTGANVYGSFFEAFGVQGFSKSLESLREYCNKKQTFHVTRAYLESSVEI